MPMKTPFNFCILTKVMLFFNFFLAKIPGYAVFM